MVRSLSTLRGGSIVTDVPTLIRKEVARRNPKKQAVFAALDLEETAVEPQPDNQWREPETNSSTPLPHREALANWPVEWRERWGFRANALEDAGLNWRDAEARAFVEV